MAGDYPLPTSTISPIGIQPWSQQLTQCSNCGTWYSGLYHYCYYVKPSITLPTITPAYDPSYKFCRVCGKELVEYTKHKEYDRKTGEPVSDVLLGCPDYIKSGMTYSTHDNFVKAYGQRRPREDSRTESGSGSAKSSKPKKRTRTFSTSNPGDNETSVGERGSDHERNPFRDGWNLY